jgi:hypothetical protein
MVALLHLIPDDEGPRPGDGGAARRGRPRQPPGDLPPHQRPPPGGDGAAQQRGRAAGPHLAGLPAARGPSRRSSATSRWWSRAWSR